MYTPITQKEFLLSEGIPILPSTARAWEIIDAAQQEISSLRSQLEEAEKWRNEYREDVIGLQKDLAEGEGQMSEMTGDILKLESELSELRESLEDKTILLEAAKSATVAQWEEIERLRLMLEISDIDKTLLALSKAFGRRKSIKLPEAVALKTRKTELESQLQILNNKKGNG